MTRAPPSRCRRCNKQKLNLQNQQKANNINAKKQNLQKANNIDASEQSMSQTKLLSRKSGSIHDLRMGIPSSLMVSPLSTTFKDKKLLHVTFKAPGDKKASLNESNKKLKTNDSRKRAESLK